VDFLYRASNLHEPFQIFERRRLCLLDNYDRYPIIDFLQSASFGLLLFNNSYFHTCANLYLDWRWIQVVQIQHLYRFMSHHSDHSLKSIHETGETKISVQQEVKTTHSYVQHCTQNFSWRHFNYRRQQYNIWKRVNPQNIWLKLTTREDFAWITDINR
jgi:hypothetical protein